MNLNWDLLKELLDEIAIPAHEKDLQDLIVKHMNSKLYSFKFTPLNNLMLKSKSKKKKRIVVCSHSDEVGFMVKNINEKGLVEVLPLGGLLLHSVYGSQFVFKTAKNTKILGVLTQPAIHEMRVINRPRRSRVGQENTRGVLYNAVFSKKQHFIDFGFNSKKDAKKAGLRVGCQGTFATKAKKIGNKKILSKALDNRVGTYLNLITSLSIHENAHYAIDRLFGVREEIGAVSITTALNNTNYDAAIVLDVSPAREDVKLGILGEGALLRIHDATHITKTNVLKHLEQLAHNHNIKLQPYFSLGGTDAGKINLYQSGIPIIPLNIAARYIHTGNSICSINDILEANKMLLAILNDVNDGWFSIF